MPYEVHLRDRRTGVRKIVTLDLQWTNEFWWREGNASCDCNRSLFMYDHDEELELPCSRGPNIIVVEKIVNDGQVVYSDEGADAIDYEVCVGDEKTVTQQSQPRE